MIIYLLQGVLKGASLYKEFSIQSMQFSIHCKKKRMQKKKTLMKKCHMIKVNMLWLPVTFNTLCIYKRTKFYIQIKFEKNPKINL